MAKRRGVKQEENRQQLTCQVNILLSEPEADALTAAAEKAKESMQLWMRTRIVEAAQRELGEHNDHSDTVPVANA